MEPTPRPRFKVCCIASPTEARLAIDAGASAIGLVSTMPSGQGTIADDQIAEIAAHVPPGVDSVLLTAAQEVDAIIAQHQAAGTSALQLVDEMPAGTHAQFRRALPGIRLVQVVHVVGHRHRRRSNPDLTSSAQHIAHSATVPARLYRARSPHPRSAACTGGYTSPTTWLAIARGIGISIGVSASCSASRRGPSPKSAGGAAGQLSGPGRCR